MVIGGIVLPVGLINDELDKLLLLGSFSLKIGECLLEVEIYIGFLLLGRKMLVNSPG
jgi:hypothetical protein